MENKMPIDDLFRNGLASGEEPMSESAWMNMERMLNGENPYADETSRKRRILPWIFGGAIVAALSVGGWWLQHQSKSTSQLARSAVETQVSPSTTASQPSSSSNTSSSTTTASSPSQPTINATPSTTRNKQVASNESTDVLNSSASSGNETSSNTSTSASTRKPKKGKQIAKATSSNMLAEAANSTSATTAAMTAEEITAPVTTEPVKSSKASRTSKTSSPSLAKSTQLGNKATKSQGPMELPTPTRVSSPLATNTTVPANNEPRAKQITKVELSERVNRLRDGSVLNKGFDTLSISSSEEPTVKPMPRWMQPDAEGKYHPRYVVLNDAQEAQAQQQRSLASNSVATDANSSHSTPNTATATPSTKPIAKTVPDETGRSQQKENSMDRLRTKAAILSADMASLSGKSCPGMSMGVHAAINNPKNNFGGFQFGLNNLKPFGDYFSLLAEVKFFIRNNSGYSIRDIMTNNKNLSMDTMSSPAHTIYSYQVDSMSHLYNFKRFAAIELPVVFQFHYRRLTAYAGLNLAYQFRINTSTVQRNFVVNHNDTVSNQLSFSMPSELGQDVTKADFHARWGLGVVGGMSYSFNPQLYVDLRMVRNLSDNAQTLAARDVSANTFKVPSVQLSLGYRFRKFIPQQ